MTSEQMIKISGHPKFP